MDENTHVFIVRIWREPREFENAEPEWRGIIQHVVSGEQRYLKDLDEMSIFITSYLKRMGVEPHNRVGSPSWYQRLVAYLAHRFF